MVAAHRPTYRLVVGLALGSVLMTACGARLTEAQRLDALAVGRAGSVAGDGAGSPVLDAAGKPLPGRRAATARPTGPGVGTGPAGPATPGKGGKAAPGGTVGSVPGDTGPGAAPLGNTRDAPAGGNGGATDTGVTASEIVVSNVSDKSGAVPGLFLDAALATQAYFAYFAAKEGTIYGRKITYKSLDSQLDEGANRSASIEACDSSFAMAGSLSAFDQGGAPVIQQCGIPDLRALATTDAMKAVPNVYSTNASGTGGSRSMAPFGWAKDKFPDAIKSAAYIYIDGAVTRQLEEQDAEGARVMLGYNWVAEPAIGISETNYAPVVQQLKSKNVRYVTFVGAYQQAAALAKEFKKQGFAPDVFQPTVTAYTPNFIKAAGDAANGVYVAVAPSLNEEIAGNPELQTYATWLQQVDPNAVPTGLGQFAWAAAALFVAKAKEVGPHLTRKALLALMPSIHNYTGNGLFPGQDVGGRKLSDCTAVTQIQNGRFVRILPASGERCTDGVWDSLTKTAGKGFPT